MGLNLDNIYNNIANSISLNSVFNDPIRTSLIIILIIIIFVYFMFHSEHNEDSEYSFNTLLFRTGFYLTLPIMTIMFIHYKNIEREYDHKYDNKALSSVIDNAVSVTGKGEKLLEFHKELQSNKNNDIKNVVAKDNITKNDIQLDNIPKSDEKIISGAFKNTKTATNNPAELN